MLSFHFLQHYLNIQASLLNIEGYASHPWNLLMIAYKLAQYLACVGRVTFSQKNTRTRTCSVRHLYSEALKFGHVLHSSYTSKPLTWLTNELSFRESLDSATHNGTMFRTLQIALHIPRIYRCRYQLAICPCICTICTSGMDQQ